MATNPAPNSVADSAAKAVATANAQPDAPAAPAAQVVASSAADTPVEFEQQAFSPDTEVQLERRGSGTTTMPREWLDSTREVKTHNRGNDAFGALSAGDDKGAPADLTSGSSTPITDEEADADEAGVTSGTSVKVDEDPDTETTGEADTTETKETQEEAPAEPEKPKAKVDLMKQGRQIRRTALDAMRIEAEKRQLEQRVRDEQSAREAESVARAAAVKDKQDFEARLQKAPLDERLRLIGIRDKEALLEMQLRGEIPDFKEAAVDPAKQAPAPDPERDALKRRLEEIEARDQVREKEHQRIVADSQRATAAAATAKAKSILDSPENAGAFKFTLAAPGAMDDVMARATQLWQAAGSLNGDVNRHLIAAAREAEAVLADQYAPILKAAGWTPPGGQGPTTRQAGPVISDKPKVTKPSVGGKRLGTTSAGNADDDLPLDPMLRDAIIKRERGWGGTQ